MKNTSIVRTSGDCRQIFSFLGSCVFGALALASHGCSLVRYEISSVPKSTVGHGVTIIDSTRSVSIDLPALTVETGLDAAPGSGEVFSVLIIPVSMTTKEATAPTTRFGVIIYPKEDGISFSPMSVTLATGHDRPVHPAGFVGPYPDASLACPPFEPAMLKNAPGPVALENSFPSQIWNGKRYGFCLVFGRPYSSENEYKLLLAGVQGRAGAVDVPAIRFVRRKESTSVDSAP